MNIFLLFIQFQLLISSIPLVVSQETYSLNETITLDNYSNSTSTLETSCTSSTSNSMFNNILNTVLSYIGSAQDSPILCSKSSIITNHFPLTIYILLYSINEWMWKNIILL